jgi:hypothetical protein
MDDQERIEKIDFIIDLFTLPDSEEVDNSNPSFWKEWACTVLEMDPNSTEEEILNKSRKDRATAQTSNKFGL